VASATGQTVVITAIVSVVRNVDLERAGHLVTDDGQAVMVAVRVLKMVEIANSGPSGFTDNCPPAWKDVVRVASATGQTVVETTTVSVVTKVVLEDGGQLRIADGQAVMVAVRVETIVEVVD
jgi:hypothetical protein